MGYRFGFYFTVHCSSLALESWASATPKPNVSYWLCKNCCKKPNFDIDDAEGITNGAEMGSKQKEKHKRRNKNNLKQRKCLNKQPSILSPVIRFKLCFQLLDFNVLPINDNIVFSLKKIEVNTSARFMKKKKGSQKNWAQMNNAV